MNSNLIRLEKLAEALGVLKDEVIFIGGACSQFYVENSEIFDFRPTLDVDFLVQTINYADYFKISEELSKLGFKHDMSEGAPIVRRIFEDILVDVIPDDSSIVGYKEIKWFKEGRKHKATVNLPSGININILTMPYYIAAKLEAWFDRGKKDYLASKDLEDIINIIDGNINLNELKNSENEVRDFLIGSFKKLIVNPDFLQSIQGHLGYDPIAKEKAKLIIEKIKDLIN